MNLVVYKQYSFQIRSLDISQISTASYGHRTGVIFVGDRVHIMPYFRMKKGGYGMKFRKNPLVHNRIRRPPKEGWSWIDRRFLSEFAELLQPDAVLLYFFLAAVSDRNGMSYYSDRSISCRLGLSEEAVIQARNELEFQDLITYRNPFYQVLSIQPRGQKRSQGDPTRIGDIMHQLASREEREENNKRSSR